jgi:hypothetical protein
MVEKTSVKITNLLFNFPIIMSSSTTNKGEILHNKLCGFCFANTTFTTNKNRLASGFIHHIALINSINVSEPITIIQKQCLQTIKQ